jgi:hypothetical protein
MGYQGRGDFRGRGNLSLIVETLLVRCVVPAREWRFNLWPAVVCVLLFLFSSLLSAGLPFFFSAGFQAGPSVRNLTAKLLTLLLASATGIVLICGIDWSGTGTSGGELCLRENRRRGCGFGLIGRRWLCGLSAQHPHPSRPWMGHPHPHLRCPPHTHPSRAWVGHPLPPLVLRCGPRWGRLRWLPMLREMERRITTGSRGVLLRY